ncbi:thermonuclease family protein [Sphingomonas sp. BT-65]|uniref:thermonuclease family protein n=1 Tax=Sphingomonas sp. BT-65 TaxID=2989821 RepID=UPI0022354BB2|nr:thermonuclease family protein [Sphingomonas sp. BT-65]MCW4461972.1 thermonuclease family protein [Sphingomonas sp. BT-65]
MEEPFSLHRARFARRSWRGAHLESRILARRPRRRSRFGRIELVTMAFAGIFAGLGWATWPMLAGDTAATEAMSAADPQARHAAALFADGESASMSAAPARGVRTSFNFCHTGGGANCVVDGDTFWMDGAKIRIADIDTPETHPARCAREAELGAAATRRLRALLNSGEVALAGIGRDTDRYGRQLHLVSVDGRGVGDTLVAEGLARPYAGGRREGWCG